jgi:hypothetical protein
VKRRAFLPACAALASSRALGQQPHQIAWLSTVSRSTELRCSIRSSGHFTGVTFLSYALVGKRVELRELAPKAQRLAVLTRSSSSSRSPGAQRRGSAPGKRARPRITFTITLPVRE